MATSPLPSLGPKRGRNCYVTPAFSGIPNAKLEDKTTSGYLTLAFSGAQKKAELLRNPYILGDPQRQARGQKSELATSPLPSRGPKRGRNCYVTPAFTGIPNAKRGKKIRSGYLTFAFSGAQKRAELLRNPYILGDPQRQARGQKSELATSPVHSRGPKRGRNCYVTPAFTGIPNAQRGEIIRSGYLTHAFSKAQKRAELVRNPCIHGNPQRQARGENQKWLPQPCLLWGPKEGGIAM